MNLRIRQNQTISNKGKLKIIAKIQLSAFMEIPEKKFMEFIREVENDPLFKKLAYPNDISHKVIIHKRFPRTSFNSSMELKEEINSDQTNIDMESVIEDHQEASFLIQKIGLKNFKKYFLDSDGTFSLEYICKDCGLSENEREKILNFVNEISVYDEFYHTSGIFERRMNYYKIAFIEHDGNKGFSIKFYSPKLSEGKYIINNSKLVLLKEQQAFSKDEIKAIDALIKKIDMINTRKSTIFQILNKIIDVQEAYLRTGDENQLIPYTQAQLSKDTGIDKSFICRSIFGKSIETPQFVEKPIKFFLPGKKEAKKRIITEILNNNDQTQVTDRELTTILIDKYNINISRRAVNLYRNELKGK